MTRDRSLADRVARLEARLKPPAFKITVQYIDFMKRGLFGDGMPMPTPKPPPAVPSNTGAQPAPAPPTTPASGDLSARPYRLIRSR